MVFFSHETYQCKCLLCLGTLSGKINQTPVQKAHGGRSLLADIVKSQCFLLILNEKKLFSNDCFPLFSFFKVSGFLMGCSMHRDPELCFVLVFSFVIKNSRCDTVAHSIPSLRHRSPILVFLFMNSLTVVCLFVSSKKHILLRLYRSATVRNFSSFRDY